MSISIYLRWCVGFLWGTWVLGVGAVTPDPTESALYLQHCASCHGEKRLGGMGPALLPESLERLRKPDATAVVTHGRVATQMPPFGKLLPPEAIAQLVQWIYTPSPVAPTWVESDIRASRIETAGAADLPAKPQWAADPLNLFVVVEGGNHHVSLVDGDRFESIHRFPSRFALHGGPKFTPDGRYVYFGSRDGWITKYDLWNLTVVAEVRAGINMRNVAVSGDGKWVMAANYLPHNLVLFDSNLELVKTYPVTSLDGKKSSRVSAVYDAAPRNSFIVALKDMPELWEISYDVKAPPIYDGFVHDYKMVEALGKPGFLGVRRTLLDEPLDDFFFDQNYRNAIGTTRPKADGSSQAQVVNLNAHQRIASFPLSGMPHLGSGITFPWKDTVVLASPNLKNGVVTVVDMKTWQVVQTIPTAGAGFFMRSHEQSAYAWVDSMMSPTGRDTLTVIEKATLQVVAQVREVGHILSHIEFTKDGRYALASLGEMQGALIVYDAKTFKEVKRLPMSKPIGKYNIGNKITRSEGTSH